MPTMPERMAIVETKLEAISQTVAGIDGKVDMLVSDRQIAVRRNSDLRKIVAVAAGLATAVSAGIGFLVDVVFRVPTSGGS